MKNKTKALLIPIAAFAVTVTGASAFNSEVLQNAGLEVEQISAFERAYELRKDGDKEGARDILMDAGVDMDTIHSVRSAMKEQRQEMHEAVEEALEDGDYEAFLDAVENSPMEDKIDTPEEFELFMEAHELKESGDKQGAREIMEDLGFEGKMMKEKGHGMKNEKKGNLNMEEMMGERGDHSERRGESRGRHNES